MDVSDRPLSDEERKEQEDVLKIIENLKEGEYYYSGYNRKSKKWEQGVKNKFNRWVWKKPI